MYASWAARESLFPPFLCKRNDVLRYAREQCHMELAPIFYSLWQWVVAEVGVTEVGGFDWRDGSGRVRGWVGGWVGEEGRNGATYAK